MLQAGLRVVITLVSYQIVIIFLSLISKPYEHSLYDMISPYSFAFSPTPHYAHACTHLDISNPAPPLLSALSLSFCPHSNDFIYLPPIDDDRILLSETPPPPRSTSKAAAEGGKSWASLPIPFPLPLRLCQRSPHH